MRREIDPLLIPQVSQPVLARTSRAFLKPSTRRPDMLPMQRLSAMRAGSRHVASAAPRLSRALKSGTWMDREMKYDT